MHTSLHRFQKMRGFFSNKPYKLFQIHKLTSTTNFLCFRGMDEFRKIKQWKTRFIVLMNRFHTFSEYKHQVSSALRFYFD